LQEDCSSQGEIATVARKQLFIATVAERPTLHMVRFQQFQEGHAPLFSR
jgi:hypothetical protein